MTGPLTEQAKALTDRVGSLVLAVEQLDNRTGRTERVTMWVVFGLLLDLVLSVAVALVVGNQFAAAADIREAVSRESITRQQGVCPIYALLIGTYNPTTRTEGQDRDAYIATFQTLNEAYHALECKLPPVPPRSDQSAIPVPPR